MPNSGDVFADALIENRGCRFERSHASRRIQTLSLMCDLCMAMDSHALSAAEQSRMYRLYILVRK